MTEKDTKPERAWSWFLRFLGAGVFAYGAISGGSVGYGYGFLGICLAALPISDFRSMIRSMARRFSGNGKEQP